MIYEAILLQGILSPTSPFDNGARRLVSPLHFRKHNDGLDSMNVLFHFHEYIVLPWAFLQISSLLCAAPREFCAEIEEAKWRIRSQGNLYKLDVMIDQRRLYPTWTLLTSRESHVDRLEADFRFFHNQNHGYDDPFEEEAADILFDSEGPLANALLALLSRFLLTGPNVWGYRSNDWSIGTLVLNIIAPEGGIDGKVIGEWTDLGVPETGVVAGEWLRESLISDVRSRLQFHTSMRGKWISTLQKRVGAVKISIDGKDEVNVPLVNQYGLFAGL